MFTMSGLGSTSGKQRDDVIALHVNGAMARVAATVRTLISYCPEGLGRLGKRIIEVEATCLRCGNETWAPGAEHGSKMSALVMLRLSCPRREQNFYVEEFATPRARARPLKGRAHGPQKRLEKAV
jgi:hypothetical protein